MTRKSFRERIGEGILLLDGGMGTEIIARDAKTGSCNEELNISSPDVIFDIHKSYIDAGSDAILTNTFGANAHSLSHRELADKAFAINTEGVKIARRAAGDDKYVIGDIGPSGELLVLLEEPGLESLKKVFTEQAEFLTSAGVDAFLIETMTDIEEALVAVGAVKSVCGDLPVFVSFAFDQAGGTYKTMMGLDVETAVRRSAEADIAGVGFNCGSIGLDDYIKLAGQYIEAVAKTGRDLAVLAELNAGAPELAGDSVVYKVSFKDYANAAEKIHQAGVNIIGGCCGTGPGHIKALAEKLK